MEYRALIYTGSTSHTYMHISIDKLTLSIAEGTVAHRWVLPFGGVALGTQISVTF